MQWLSSLVNEYEGTPLQKSGQLTKDQLTQFFDKSREQFNSQNFKQLLKYTHDNHRNTQDVVNGMQTAIFQSLGIQGDFGISFLSKIRNLYGNDAAFMRMFYEFVQLEEMILDEAELPDHLMKSKYDKLNKMKEVMEAQMEQLKDLTPEQQQAFMANIYHQMIVASGAGEEDCCSQPGDCAHKQAAAVGPPGVAGASGPAMSDDEQLAFFQSLNRK